MVWLYLATSDSERKEQGKDSHLISQRNSHLFSFEMKELIFFFLKKDGGRSTVVRNIR